ncbi:MAG: hypothetical protein HZT41_07280 [Dechloromonas sp.]|nr:MAG: hypothetical protein HZT41_07280 [Dechloromonas sp.]
MSGQLERGILPPIGQPGDRDPIGGDAVAIVNPDIGLAMHIDCDQGNAGNTRTGVPGCIDEIKGRARGGAADGVAAARPAGRLRSTRYSRRFPAPAASV